jgi:hypothetical protein
MVMSARNAMIIAGALGRQRLVLERVEATEWMVSRRRDKMRFEGGEKSMSRGERFNISIPDLAT